MPLPHEHDAFDVLVIADPQIIDQGTYGYAWPLYQLAKLVSDVYLRKGWLAITGRGLGSWLFAPRWRNDLVVFLGDMSDRGRWSHDLSSWTGLQNRWERIYRGAKLIHNAGGQGITRRTSGSAIPAVLVPGNHDIGLPDRNGAPQHAYADAHMYFYQRYAMSVNEKHVLDANSSMRSWNVRLPISADNSATTHELVLINALDLVGMEPWGDYYNKNFIESAKKHAPDTTSLVEAVQSDISSVRNIPRILFSHVPLARDSDEHSCDVPWRTSRHGVRRESKRGGVPGGNILQGGGIDKTYQNLVQPHVSSWVLDSIEPAVVFSGDDHDHCEAIHKGVRTTAKIDGSVHGFAETDTPELTVKSVSMLEGVRRPGYARLRLYAPHSTAGAPSIDYEPCLLPDQMGIWLWVYLPCAVLTVAFLVYKSIPRTPLLPIADEIPLDGSVPVRKKQVRKHIPRILRNIYTVGLAPFILWVAIQVAT
ncbi:hypothetical protein MCUN1_003710 [Malassezia cuniculi]|uniref:Calcineurin-like phosphoesterase domain-containing protein n=1 Tax=Malassezia cuniculi TaxID=948313 RepID=A0AAF0EU25_9BASI|nr:hypothetical protein MCUN1_003710 [Malassezia cuniculi]